MALSGSFSKMPTSSFGLYCTWSAKQSVTGNYSDVTLNVYLKYYSLYVGSRSDSKISINGVSETYTTPAISQGSNSAHTTLLKSKTVRVNHTSNGTKTGVALSASWRFSGTYSGVSIGTITASTTIDLNSIDRSAPTVTFKTSSITANGFTISAYSSASSDVWQYSLNGGSSYSTLSSSTGTSASKTITGLSPNTSYSVKVRARKKSNQVYGYSSATSVKTLGGATFSSVNTLTADNSTVTISFRATVYDSSYKYRLRIKNGSTEYLSISNITLTKGTLDRTVTLTSTQRSALLSKMANLKSFTGTFCLDTFSGSTQIGNTSFKDATVQTTSSNSTPTFTSFTCVDSNSITVTVTGNSNYFIQGYSQLKVTPSTANAKNGASITSYSATCNGVTSSNSTESALNLGTVSKTGTVEVIVKVTDSRGYTKSVSKNITVIEYTIPKIQSSTLRRTNEIEAEMQLSFNGSFSSITIGSTRKNSLQYVRYRYKKTSDDDFGAYINILSGVNVSSSNFSFENLELCNLDSNFSYDFQLQIIDRLDDLILDFIVPQGTPLVALRKQKVGINNPNPTVALDVIGDAKVDGGKVWHGKNLEIQIGSYYFTGLTTNVTKTEQITFTVPFSVAPTITCSPYSTYPQICNVGVSSVTTKGFKLNFNRGSTSSTTVYWQAIAII